MDSTRKFKPEIAVDAYLQQLSANGNYTSADMAELKSHLLDQIADLKITELNEEEAFIVAKKRLGKESELNTEFNKVNKYNDQWIIFFLGVFFYIIASTLYNAGQKYLMDYVMSGQLNGKLALWLNSIFQVGVAAAIFGWLNKTGNILYFFKRKFIHQPVLMCTLLLTAVCCCLFFSGEKQLLVSNLQYINMENYRAYYGSRKWSIIVPFLVPVSFILCVSAAFYRAFSLRSPSWRNLMKTGNIVFYLAYGFCVELLAAMTRMIGDGNTSSEMKPVYFGIVYTLGVFSVVYFSTQGTIKKIGFFCLTGACLELWGGTVNEYGRMTGYINLFFIALIIAIITGIFFGKLLKQKRLLPGN